MKIKTTEKEKTLCKNDKMTIKCYLILKQIYGKDEAMKAIKTAPINKGFNF